MEVFINGKLDGCLPSRYKFQVFWCCLPAIYASGFSYFFSMLCMMAVAARTSLDGGRRPVRLALFRACLMMPCTPLICGYSLDRLVLSITSTYYNRGMLIFANLMGASCAIITFIMCMVSWPLGINLVFSKPAIVVSTINFFILALWNHGLWYPLVSWISLSFITRGSGIL